MAEDSSRASSPEPGEALPPRGRIIQLNSSSRSSMDRQSLESGRSPAYSSQSHQWRSGSPPRSRFPRPYSSNGGGRGGYFKRQQMSYEGGAGGAPYQRERVFSRSRGRSVSRSPSRASQRTQSRSRSHSPRSPKSPPRSRSRSRSRSFSPRGHRTFANWERGGRTAGAPPYASGRGRGGSFDSRQRGRERDSWPRGGGRGGGRYTNYQRGNRFYPKEVRYKPAAPLPHHRSISRDRGSSEGSAAMASSYRDRPMRDYEPGYRARTREGDMRSTSLVRASSISSDYYRDSEPSASAEEGEEKPEESHVTTSERSVESRTPSETGSADRDMTDSMRRAASALPPRPFADSHASYRKVAVSEDGYGDRSPLYRREMLSRRTMDDVEHRGLSRSASMEVDEGGKRRRIDRYQAAPRAVVSDIVKEEYPTKLKDEVHDTGNAAAAEDQGDDSNAASARKASLVIEDDKRTMETGGEGGVRETQSQADNDVDHSSKAEISPTLASSDAAETPDSGEVRQKSGVKSSEASVTVEDEVRLLKEEPSSVNERVSNSPDVKDDVSNKESNLPAVASTSLSAGEDEKQEAKECREQEPQPDNHGVEETSSARKGDDVDMEDVADNSSKREDPVHLESEKQVAADVEMKSGDGDDESSAGQEVNLSEAEPYHAELNTDDSVTELAAKPKEVICSDTETQEVEEGEMMVENYSPTIESAVARDSTSNAKDGEAVFPPSSSSGDSQEGKRAEDTVKANVSPVVREKRAKLERSKTDPSSGAYSDTSKPRSTSFSAFGLPNGSRREGIVREKGKAMFASESEFSLKAMHGDKRGIFHKQRDESSPFTHKNSPQQSERPGLDRQASFSTLLERGQYLSSETRQGGSIGYASGSQTSRSTSSFAAKTSPPKPSDGRKRGLFDNVRREDATKRELLRAGSMDTTMDRHSLRSFPMPERAQVARDSPTTASPSRRDVGDARASRPREETPALPNIPLPSDTIRETSSPNVLGDGTPTKRHRPRLGWGQGLVAQSPPQPAKRPRIGWGQGLMQHKDDTSREKENTSGVVSEGGDTSGDASADKTGEATVGSLTSPNDQRPGVKDVAAGSVVAVTDASDRREAEVFEIQTPVTPTPEQEKQSKTAGAEDSVSNEVEEAGDQKMTEAGDIEQDDVAPTKPSKEEILSTIDVLDSDIAGVKKQMKALQRMVASGETKRESSSEPVDMDIVSTGELDSAAASSKVDPTAGENSPNFSSVTSSDRPLLTSPVKVAVDSRFVELLADVFSDNLRKSVAANDELPKRLEQGQLATKIYHQPSDYAFYQENIDRGSVISDEVRLKVRMRNRARHDYMKKLAREYVDLKKSWKQGVKKMEKDRKRQDKLRLKQLQKQKLKSLGESGPIRTTNTNHQSPHVQQLVAAEKAAEAAGEGTIVRTSSRLTNNSSADLENNDLEKIEQAKAQALLDQEVRKKRLKNALSTVIPDMLITPAERQQRYFTRFVNGQSCMADGLVTDLKLKEKAEMKVNPWNDLEKCIYMDKFLQFPKNFPRISSYLRNKTTGDVIAFYYRTKKVADYKALLREQQLRRRGAGSKNTWSCWNLSACAAICLGVQFPQHVAKLLLHPSNFRSHQASDNILNSAGAQRLLRGSKTKAEGDGNMTTSSAEKATDSAEGKCALDMVSGSDHTPCIRPSVPDSGVQLDDVINSGDSDASDEEKFNLYTQQLEQFIAGQQRPFLVDYASLFTDNSYSTGYEVSTLSIEERLKKYPTPSKELESVTGVITGITSTSASQDFTKVKQQSQSAGSTANPKNGGTHLTKKELKQQRKLKKMQEGTAAAAATTPTSAPVSAQSGGEKSGGHRKKSAAGSSSTLSGSSSNRNTPRISVPRDEKAAQSGKKSSRSGGATPGPRRNNQTNATTASPKINVASNSAAAGTAPVSITAPTTGAVKKGSSGGSTPHTNARTSSPSANAGVNSSANAAPAKRVVQKWTEGEKADFLKYFSQYGKDWATLTENIPTKTAAQIKNYYQNYKNRLNLQDILKRRIENAAASGGSKGAAGASGVASGSVAVSPRSAAAGLMSGTLRQMGRSVELSGGMSMGMPSGSMAMNASDPNMSFQAALSAAQPGMHGVNVLSELSANQFAMQAHQDQQQSREMMNSASNPERYLKLLNMQHQLQIMQFQQQQKSQGMTSEGEGNNNNSYHEGQMNAANAQRLYQFSRQQQQQQQHQVPPQHVSMQAQQMGLQGHAQTPTHSQVLQIQQQQQARASFAEMGHPGGMYQSVPQMQNQHSQAMAGAVQLSPTHAQHFDRQVDSGGNGSTEGGVVTARANVGIVSSQMGSHGSMMSMAMMSNAASGHVSSTPQGIAANSSNQPPLAPPRSMPMEASRQTESWKPAPASTGVKTEDTTTTTTTPATEDNAPKGREALAPPALPPVQPVRSRMSFSSILNESESPRDDSTPRGHGSMVIRQQDSPREQQQQQREQQQIDQQQPSLRVEHARAMPSSSAELARSPVSDPSPTAHLLPRRSSVPAQHNRMGLMSSLLNVPSPEHRSSTPGHQSPLMHQQQQQMQRQMQPSHYYDANASSAESAGTASIALVSGMPASSTMSATMARTSPSEKMTSSASSMATYTNTSAQMAVALSRSGSASSTSSAVSNAGDPRAQQQMWNYSPQIRFEEAELLRRAQRAEEEAARARAAAAAAAKALQEAQQARQQALDMAANMARYNNLSVLIMEGDAVSLTYSLSCDRSDWGPRGGCAVADEM
ncbi:hypothetical protein PI124_g12144 [Phytophthora idaei]|nr:hypothetical protein PI126_g9001 [Phytophthora idaei]KAG3243049.1 hypothetical protein PI124_g12144 [Phytophthora idaei]